MTEASRKSTRAVLTAETGIRIRGKYTFVTSCVLPNRLAAPALKAFEKNIHGSSPEYANSEYGAPSDGSRATRPKIATTINMAINGWSTAHARPRGVWF